MKKINENISVEYKDIPWYEWKYQVSSLWEVIRLSDRWEVKVKILKWYSYWKWWNLYVWLCENWNRIRVRICDEVAKAFIRNPNWYKFVWRKDWDINNNKVNNLFWTDKNSNRRKITKKRLYLEFAEWYFDNWVRSENITETYEYYISHIK